MYCESINSSVFSSQSSVLMLCRSIYFSYFNTKEDDAILRKQLLARFIRFGKTMNIFQQGTFACLRRFHDRLRTDHGQLSRHSKVEIPKFCVVGRIDRMKCGNSNNQRVRLDGRRRRLYRRSQSIRISPMILFGIGCQDGLAAVESKVTTRQYDSATTEPGQQRPPQHGASRLEAVSQVDKASTSTLFPIDSMYPPSRDTKVHPQFIATLCLTPFLSDISNLKQTVHAYQSYDTQLRG